LVSVTPLPHFSPGERTPSIHCTGGWVVPRTVLDTKAKGKILSPMPEIVPRSPERSDHSQTLYWLSYSAPSLERPGKQNLYVGISLVVHDLRAYCTSVKILRGLDQSLHALRKVCSIVPRIVGNAQIYSLQPCSTLSKINKTLCFKNINLFTNIL
jgi:hypothetical protein